MLRKKRLKCGRITARLFLACHQKSNTFKCKQFCCAKPMCACLSAGCPSVPPQRRAAVLDKPTETSEGTACEARRTSTHSFKLRRVCVRMCRATDWEPQAMYCGAALRGYRGIPPCFAFLLQAFSFSNKKKMPKRGKYTSFD